MDDMQEILEDFLVEASELTEQLDEDLVNLETNPEDKDLLNQIFRVAHTIKGSGSFLNLDVLTELTHHMEDVLNKARHGELVIDADIMDVVFESIDLMKALLDQIKETGTDQGDIQIAETVTKLDNVLKGKDIEEGVDEAAQTGQKPDRSGEDDKSKKSGEQNLDPAAKKIEQEAADINPEEMDDDEVEAEIERLLQVRQEEDKKRREEKKKQQGGETKEEPKKEEPKPQSKPAPKKPAAKSGDSGDAKPAPKKKATTVEQTIRVDVSRLDHLMNLIGELVLGKNRLSKIYNDVEERYEGEQFLEELSNVVSGVSVVTSDLQIAVMKTRMLPVGKVFNKFPRMVRDLSRELKKDIELVISGEETELDKSIVEEIGDPLVHIIRNSCDHGVETPAERVKAGKPEKGTVNLKAYNEGNNIIIEIGDDGKGLDPDVLINKSLEKGVINEKEADRLSEKEAFALIFRPGLSTADAVTNVSGRGVGMDVVKTNIEKLNGIIDIDSEKGKGTVIKLKIPLTLAIIQSLLVNVQEELFAIPLSSVLETVRITTQEVEYVEGKTVLRLRNEVLPLVHIADIYDVERTYDTGEHAYVVIIGLAEKKLGLIVDELVGQEEIVIKSLGEYIKGIEGIAGATIRGDGGVTLICDVGALMDMSKEASAKAKDAMESTGTSKERNSPEDYTILIVDDSKTDRTIMKKSLEPLGVSHEEAVNGEEALAKMKDTDADYDAVLIDIEMPKMDGYTLAGEIRKFNRYKNLPLIAVTSRTSKSDRMRGVEVGMTEYITKPYSQDYLANVVKRNINLK
ncbi:MAG: hybrid sensor histidine kinase/response regulator [Campylobacterota bacterium]